MMRTGSIRDINKRHIPIKNAENRNQDIGNTASSSIPPQKVMPSILPSMNNGKKSSSSMVPSMNSMMSTGSTRDMRRRGMPRTTAAERQNRDCAATGSGNQGTLLNTLDQQGDLVCALTCH